MSELINKLSFDKEFGSPKRQAGAHDRISKVIDGDDHWSKFDTQRLAYSAEAPLSSEHLHKIIDKPMDPKNAHPASFLPEYHFGDLQDDHWHKIATHPDKNVVMRAINHMPLRHLRTAAKHPHLIASELAHDRAERIESSWGKE